ncbi:PEP/pyruvate-binding domain-containing protein [Serinicoccus kebangsaanensis]|uniref:PEP/pyruvate-binding domain-containing protein n=1 Tax=Serinicoccus kebangsaanensis TaxID=2602069 RepID=UPI00124CEE74|nr:PEP/pyruvate-binding domain-containing protein [Serinicoccus kebangsaanensis]
MADDVIRWLADVDASMLGEVGGKAANLGELLRAGLPVPDGFVLTTAAYAPTRPGETLPGEVRERVAAAYEELGERAGTEDVAVAVRSSATAEDLPEASFAGQQDTFLHVIGVDAVLRAVRDCWAGLRSERATAYRRRQGIDEDGVAMAVVVQRLVPAHAAGVLFTANPSTGARDEMVVNAAWGLGEAVVGGLVTPDTVLLSTADPDAPRVVREDIATKDVRTVPSGTGTQEESTPAGQADQPALDRSTLLDLAALGVRIAEHFGAPMDVEWASGEEGIAILQARAITSLPPAPLRDVRWEPPVADTVWMRRQVVEHMPEPLSPLFEELYLRRGLHVAIGELGREMGRAGGVRFDFDRMVPHGFGRTINGYAYTTVSFDYGWPTVRAIVGVYARMPRLFHSPAFDWHGVVLPRYQQVRARWTQLDVPAAPSEELLEGLAELALEDARYWFGSALDLGMSRLLDPFFGAVLRLPPFRGALPDPGLGSSAFLRGFGSPALDAQADLEDLAAQVRSSRELRALVLDTAPEELLGALDDHPDGAAVRARLGRHLTTYGHQIYNLDFADPTMGEDPSLVISSLRTLVDTEPEKGAQARREEIAARREELLEQTRQGLGPVGRAVFDRLWRLTARYAPMREHVVFHLGSGWPAARRLAAELGRRLVETGALREADDVYFLTDGEIRSALGLPARTEDDARSGAEARQDQDVPDAAELADLAHERRELRAARSRLAPPPVVPERGGLRVGPFTLTAFHPTPEDSGEDGDVLTGFAVSSGQVTAPASVIGSTADFHLMRPGTILVARTTTPAWTPLFAQAAGLVTDVGGALAHGSIVAREYGIPAVMGTGAATERITSGTVLTIDGDRGTVRLHDDDAGQES